MVFGEHKKELLKLREEVGALREKIKEMEKVYPDYKDYQALKKDLFVMGGALIEIRRVHPDSVFIKS